MRGVVAILSGSGRVLTSRLGSDVWADSGEDSSVRTVLKAKHLAKFGAEFVGDDVVQQIAHHVLVWRDFFSIWLKQALVVLLLFEFRESSIERF
jgi:hypothetical protein